MLIKIISGGQTGADRAALDVAIELGIPHGGWVPKGRKTEDGRLGEKYMLKETTAIDYAQRTEFNILDSDATLIISHGKIKGGTALTQQLAAKHHRPCLHIDLDTIEVYQAIEIIDTWINTRGIQVLNVAGPRSSEDPHIYADVQNLLRSLLYPPPESLTGQKPHSVKEAVDHIISELSLKDKSEIANMHEDAFMFLQSNKIGNIIKGFWITRENSDLLKSCEQISGKIDTTPDEAVEIILKELRRALQKSHGLRRIK